MSSGGTYQGAPLVIVRAAAVIPLWGLLAPGSPRPSTPMHAAHATRLKRPVAPLHGTPLDTRVTVVGDSAQSRAEPLPDGILRRERLAALRTILYDLGQLRSSLCSSLLIYGVFVARI